MCSIYYICIRHINHSIMKSFWKTTLAVICGVIITSILCSLLCSFIFGAIMLAGSSKPSVPKDAVLKIDDLTITEQSTENSSFSIGTSLDFNTDRTLGIRQAVQAINKAADDPGIKFIYLKADNVFAGMSALEEFRIALANFRSSGKPVIAYTENTSTGSYYLASVADKIYMTDCIGGMQMMLGVGGRLIFIKDLLDKLGVRMQLIRHGKYKSAGEMYIRNEASKENLEQTQVMIDGIWKSMGTKMAENRGMSLEELNSLIDNLVLCDPEDFAQNGLVDGLLDRDALEQKLADLAVVDKFKDVKMVSLQDYAEVKVPEKVAVGDKIAIIYADGQIIDGIEKEQVAGKRFAGIISKVRKDSTVKAVVLRVNSPGGSVFASEEIKKELDKLKNEKLLVASYGDYAASGGYWISNGASRIFSNETTLTGSIGVFSAVPEMSGTLKNIAHVNVTTVNSNAHSDMFTTVGPGALVRPFDDKEIEYMQKGVETVYDAFLDNVAAGRNMTREAVDEIAQGRVWTGSDALRIGLVDEIGTLEDAINYTAAQLGDKPASEWNIVSYPKPLSMQERLLGKLMEKNNGEDALTAWLKSISKPVMMARMPYDIEFTY